MNTTDLHTPETDAFAIKFKTLCGEKYWVPVDIARKLERERDAARDIGEKLSKQGLDMMDENRSLKRERDTALDEARAYSKGTWQSLRNSQDEVLRLTFENRKISQELDEARDTIMKIEEIFIDSEDMRDDWIKVGNIARTFCEK